jgi:hypothetical protein
MRLIESVAPVEKMLDSRPQHQYLKRKHKHPVALERWCRMPFSTDNRTDRERGGRVALLLALAAILPASGCGDDALGRQAVSGTVTLKGKPVEVGMLEFRPAAPASDGATYTRSGAVIADGKFDIPKEKGLVPGKYKVSISAPDKHHKLGGDELPGPTSSRTSKDLIPPEYNLKTKLEVEVKNDRPNTFDFAVP